MYRYILRMGLLWMLYKEKTKSLNIFKFIQNMKVFVGFYLKYC